MNTVYKGPWYVIYLFMNSFRPVEVPSLPYGLGRVPIPSL